MLEDSLTRNFQETSVTLNFFLMFKILSRRSGTKSRLMIVKMITHSLTSLSSVMDNFRGVMKYLHEPSHFESGTDLVVIFWWLSETKPSVANFHTGPLIFIFFFGVIGIVLYESYQLLEADSSFNYIFDGIICPKTSVFVIQCCTYLFSAEVDNFKNNNWMSGSCPRWNFIDFQNMTLSFLPSSSSSNSPVCPFSNPKIHKIY